MSSPATGMRTANKEWICEACGDTIAKGERHLVRLAAKSGKKTERRIGIARGSIKAGLAGLVRYCLPCAAKRWPEETRES